MHNRPGSNQVQDRTSTLQHSRRSTPRDTFLDRKMKLCAAAGGIGKHDLSEDFQHLIAHCMSKPFRARLSLESWKVGRYKKLCNEVVQLLVFGLEGWSARGTRLPLVRPVILVVPEKPRGTPIACDRESRYVRCRPILLFSSAGKESRRTDDHQPQRRAKALKILMCTGRTAVVTTRDMHGCSVP